MLLNKLIWYDDYLSGIDVIDEQHVNIFKSFNKFYEAINSVEISKTDIDDFIKALDFYTFKHFDTEEQIMKETNYPDYKAHLCRHNFFKSLYNEIKDNKFFTHHTGHFYALNLAKISGEWWETHIVTYDVELTSFLKRMNYDFSKHEE